MSKRRPPWGLMGLLGLGGLMMMGSDREDDSDGSGGRRDDDSGGRRDDDKSDRDDPVELPPPVLPPPPTDDATDPIELPPPVLPTEPPGPPAIVEDPPPIEPTEVLPVIPEDDDPVEPIEVIPVIPEPNEGPPFSELTDPYPRGGIFYQVVRDDRFGGTSSRRSIAYRVLLSEAYLAATEVRGMAHEDALQWAVTVGRQDKLRLAVIDLIQCSGWNDAMYGTDPVRVSHASAHGRSILLRPVHANNGRRLARVQPPIRNITLAGNPADGSQREYELLWCPAIDRVVLWDSGGQVITTTGMTWPDGSSMENPPPWVMALGIDDESGVLDGSFGCPGTDGELEVSG